ncbi:type II toxin-antitoxin system VapC family toxin [Silvibacterium dinghuense]|uniref:Type II toxin-antitoxin system VapC family toxin n=1 Tax=Silvibacterium dinghuense TaxID=1560006 RepID=A0A4Q1SHM1_9BACT|nr:type II toxin-antitoxin system VapC family toxin [Silvibacterium dinghuense]RXS97056.1 type II toxin-antitoxin system VapC family toxin [Silvibacterium dinghuense]GGG95825.1 twitching motility protein PilT [Silvibacterium dinghuense]
MRYLLDTHTLIWAGESPEKLTPRVRAILADETITAVVSAVSAWEIATKVRLARLPEAVRLEEDFLGHVSRAGYELLSITPAVALRAGRLSGDHGDPFDRMLAAQALAEDMPILSLDAGLDLFGVRRIWQ